MHADDTGEDVPSWQSAPIPHPQPSTKIGRSSHQAATRVGRDSEAVSKARAEDGGAESCECFRSVPRLRSRPGDPRRRYHSGSGGALIPPHPPTITEEPRHGKPAMPATPPGLRIERGPGLPPGYHPPGTPGAPEPIIRPCRAGTAKARLLYLTQPLCPSSSSVFSSWRLPRPCWRLPLPCRLDPGRHSGGPRRTLPAPRPPCCPRKREGEGERGRGNENERRGPAPSSPTSTSDAGSRARWSGRGECWDGGGLCSTRSQCPPPRLAQCAQLTLVLSLCVPCAHLPCLGKKKKGSSLQSASEMPRTRGIYCSLLKKKNPTGSDERGLK